MRCYLCHRGMSTGDTLHRINPKGQTAVWACEVHRTPGHVVPPEVRFMEAALDPDADDEEPGHDER